MKILILGDVMGSPGRLALRKNLSKVIQENEIKFSVINGENAADDGRGITKQIAEEIFSNGIDVITSGNHIWDKEETIKFIVDPKHGTNIDQLSDFNPRLIFVCVLTYPETSVLICILLLMRTKNKRANNERG